MTVGSRQATGERGQHGELEPREAAQQAAVDGVVKQIAGVGHGQAQNVHAVTHDAETRPAHHDGREDVADDAEERQDDDVDRLAQGDVAVQ